MNQIFESAKNKIMVCGEDLQAEYSGLPHL